MKTLDEIGLTTGAGGDKASDRHNYLKRYEPFFAPFRELPIRLLEIGIENGYSVKMWLEYFPEAEIYGVDILSKPDVHDPRFIFIQGDQSNIDFWASFSQNFTQPFDIIIDDGSHRTSGIETSFEILFPVVRSGGYYLIEDLSCAYMSSYQEMDWANQMEFIFRLVNDMNSQLQYRPPHWEKLRFPDMTVSSLGIDWMQLSEELVIIKKK